MTKTIDVGGLQWNLREDGEFTIAHSPALGTKLSIKSFSPRAIEDKIRYYMNLSPVVRRPSHRNGNGKRVMPS